ncbi:MAG: hypothetical protein RI907_1116 [Pseudomonadota bacterium]|jgi:hypothetical protein
MNIRHQGACLCGGIRFHIDGPLQAIQVCHCSQCRQAQGGPVATNIPVDAHAVTFEQGQDLLQPFESSPGKIRAFCKVCGSPIYSQRAALPGVLRIRAGLLREPVAATLAFQAHTASRANWWPTLPGLADHPEGAPDPLPSAP